MQTPMIAPEETCVVDTGRANRDATPTSRDVTALATKPFAGAVRDAQRRRASHAQRENLRRVVQAAEETRRAGSPCFSIGNADAIFCPETRNRASHGGNTGSNPY